MTETMDVNSKEAALWTENMKLKSANEHFLSVMQEACDLLAERKHGTPARSPGHNARLLLEGCMKFDGHAAGDHTEGLQGALRAIKDLVVGERFPRWVEDGWAVTVARGKIADICDTALGTRL